MRRAILTMMSVVFLSTVAGAEFTRGSQTATILGGLGWAGGNYSYQPGSDEPVSGGGGAVGGQYLYYATGNPAVGVGLDLMNSMNGTRTDDDLLTNYNTDQRVKSLVGLVIAKLSYPRGKFRPFVFGGLGFHSSSQLLTATPRAGITWPNAPTSGTRVLVDEHKTSVAFGGGVGFDIFPVENFFIGTEFRMAVLGGMDTDQNAAINNAGFTLREKTGLSQGNILFRTGVKF